MLDVGSGSHAQQTARVMERLEPVLARARARPRARTRRRQLDPGRLARRGQVAIPVGHIEAGLRSFDRTMPEEINRIVADAVADLLFTHSPEARENLLPRARRGHAIHEVGNTMIDTLVAMLPRIRGEDAPARHGMTRGGYLSSRCIARHWSTVPLLVDAVAQLAAWRASCRCVFPVHPRTRAALEAMGIARAPWAPPRRSARLPRVPGPGRGAAGVLTDSGGIQEETTHLGIPCFTLRDNTERPMTVEWAATPARAGARADRRSPGIDLCGKNPRSRNRPRLGRPCCRADRRRAGRDRSARAAFRVASLAATRSLPPARHAALART